MSRARWIVYALAALGVVAYWSLQINAKPVDRDAAQSLQMAVNLAHHGIISLDTYAPWTPTMYREPLPVLVSAAMISLSDSLHGPKPAAEYFEGERLRFVKLQNLFWLALLIAGVCWAAELLSQSVWAALLAMLFTLYALDRNSNIFDDLYSDLPAAALLMVASVALALSVSRRQGRYAALAGALMGLLCLTKAAALYVFVGVVLSAAMWCWLQSSLVWERRAAILACLVGGCAAVVAPWSLRNEYQLGTFQLTQRAGVVLLCRAIKDRMTHIEYLGTFYVWAPPRLQPYIGSLLHFSPSDLRRGGRLQHLNRSSVSDFAKEDYQAELAGRPDLAISYYRQSRAERMQLLRELMAAGTPNPGLRADTQLQQRALRMIASRPWDHITATLPFLWRGALRSFPWLLAALLVAWRTRRHDLAAFALPAFGMVMFYALLSHFIPRYGIAMEPVGAVCAAMLIVFTWRRIVRRRALEPRP